MTAGNYINTDSIAIRRVIRASVLQEILDTLDEKIYGALNGAEAHNFMRFSDFSTLIIAGGAITITSMSHRVESESGNSDTLDTINVTPSGVQMIILRAQGGHTITVSHNTGNIKLTAGVNFTLTFDKMLVLFREGSTWYDVATSATAGSANVSSVAMTVPSILSVGGSPITSSGTLALALANQSANRIFAGPTNGAAAAPTFRAAVLADLPIINTARLLGRATSGAGAVEELTLGTGLQVNGGAIEVVGAGAAGGENTSGNLITNGRFTIWERGTSSAPDNWALTGGSATIAREASIIKYGDYSAKVTRVGNDCHFSQDVYAKGGKTFMRSRTYVFGAWVYATVASRVRLRVNDGTTTSYSSYHTGSSTWEWLTVTVVIDAAATAVVAGLAVDTADTSGYFSGATFTEGTTMTYAHQPALLENKFPTRCTLWHDEATILAGNGFVKTFDASQPYGFFTRQSTAAQNDAFSQSFYLAAGTYTFSVLGAHGPLRAMVTWYIDGESAVANQDWYNGSGAFDITKTASVTVRGDGWHHLRGLVNTRNGSNVTDWQMTLTKYWFKPTSD